MDTSSPTHTNTGMYLSYLFFHRELNEVLNAVLGIIHMGRHRITNTRINIRDTRREWGATRF